MSHDAEKLTVRITGVLAVLVAVASIAFAVGAWKSVNEKNWEIQRALNEQLMASVKDHDAKIVTIAANQERDKSSLDELRSIVLANRQGAQTLKNGLPDRETRASQ